MRECGVRGSLFLLFDVRSNRFAGRAAGALVESRGQEVGLNQSDDEGRAMLQHPTQGIQPPVLRLIESMEASNIRSDRMDCVSLSPSWTPHTALLCFFAIGVDCAGSATPFLPYTNKHPRPTNPLYRKRQLRIMAGCSFFRCVYFCPVPTNMMGCPVL